MDEGAFYCRCFICMCKSETNKSIYSVFLILKAIRITQIINQKKKLQYLPQQGKDTWNCFLFFLGSIKLNKQVDKHQLSISFEPRTKINKLKNNLLS